MLTTAVFLAAWLRYDFNPAATFSAPIAQLALIALAAHLLLGGIAGPYAVGHLRGSYEEIIDLTRTVALWALPLQVVTVFGPWNLGPRSLPVTAGAVALIGMFGARFVLRTARSHIAPSSAAEQRVLVFGAGEGGRQLVRTLVRDPSGSMVPVGLIDDNKSKRRMRIDGVRVLGATPDLVNIAEKTEATTLAIAVPSASAELVRTLRALAEDAGLSTLILPRADEILGPVGGSDLRSLDLADFLGRRPIELDATAIADTISGRTVLVTGAGGSIGSELCRQIGKFGPSRLIMLDRDESALHGTQLSVTGQGLLESDDVVLADIRDADRMVEVFQHHRPDVVFHAAALKHLPLLEMYPEEAWKTNVLGTLNVLRAAHTASVSTFVNVSTDKAANPSCVLGYSKRVTERLTAYFADIDDHTYVSVRFGNVLGSRGSVITAFTSQIERGGPITVTHPDVERYFMLIPEACQLVLQAAAIGRDGQVMVLDMGEPMKIVDVAKTLIDLSQQKDIEIIYTGLRPGEKMSEELFTPGESIESTAHELVSSVDVPSLAADQLLASTTSPRHSAVAWMRQCAYPADVHATR
ncbi:nucleoside-diphosphate sugar epimerase/dehydratase [Janibacter cremeus]|uniref:polysaccharide biosynthesis protein n=1 Tax=Janibacter cremeus TaxID=1285192 RepID=UPI0023F89DE7|nr:nucleoside-diphosphate sugar epimerase/dehydratase [Janibacter cremeus]WEV78221.1 nucleoside-diphosphate sugar epimerase/dehydratase [Janibacter cremeus]WEV78301.1 nucleoside-diphosphate sugar epimerase/dehydratase [Janibacter cremeus]